jgi:hypothetical protein
MDKIEPLPKLHLTEKFRSLNIGKTLILPWYARTRVYSTAKQVGIKIKTQKYSHTEFNLIRIE